MKWLGTTASVLVAALLFALPFLHLRLGLRHEHPNSLPASKAKVPLEVSMHNNIDATGARIAGGGSLNPRSFDARGQYEIGHAAWPAATYRRKPNRDRADENHAP